MSDTPTKSSIRRAQTTRDPYPKRQKKATTMEARRYSPSRYMKPEWEPTKGGGVFLKDIVVIDDHVKQVSRNEDFLKQIHLLMYSHTPKTKDVKKNILAFSGFSKEYDDEDRTAFIDNKLTPRGHKFLSKMYLFLGLKKLGTESKDLKDKKSEEIAEEIFDFLQSPERKKVLKKKTDFSLGKKKKTTSTTTSSKKKKTKKRDRSDTSEDEAKSEGEETKKKKRRRSGPSAGGSKSDDEAQSTPRGKKRKSRSSSDNEEEKDESKNPKKKSKSGKEKAESSSNDLRNRLESGQFLIQYAPDGRAKCADKDCKTQIKKDEIRIIRASGSDKKVEDMNLKYYHPECLFKAQTRFREKTEKVESTSDLIDFKELESKDQKIITKLVKDNPTSSAD